MVEQQLSDYVKKQLSSGYDTAGIKAKLAQAGYGRQAIDEAFAAEKPHKKMLIIGAIAVALLALMALASLLLQDKEELPEAYYLISSQRSTVAPGEYFEFFIQSNIEGSAVHNVYDSNGNLITFNNEAVGNGKSSIFIPLTAKEGEHSLESTVAARGESMTATLQFMVGKKKQDAVQRPKAPEQANVAQDKQPAPAQDGNIPEQNNTLKPTEDKPAEKPQFAAFLEDIRKAASRDAEAAAQQCKLLSSPNEKDSCYEEIVEVSRQRNYCESISDDERRDICLLSFVVIEKDYTVCEEFLDEDLRYSCHELEKDNVQKGQPAKDDAGQLAPAAS